MELCYRNNTKSLFKKYAHLITYFANLGIGRDYLGIPKGKVALLLPNGYHLYDRGVYRATFYTRPVFVPKLYKSLVALDRVAMWIKGFDEAMKILTWQTGLSSSMPALIRSVNLTITTFFPDPNPETATVDGTAERSGVDETFTTIRAGAGVNADDSAATMNVCRLIATATTDQFSRLGRGFFLFDTSSIPDSEEINSAVFSLIKDASSSTGLGDTNADLVASTPASNTAIAAGDYGNVGSTRFATGNSISSMNTGSYNDWNLNSSGLANITTTGISKFAVRLKWDFDNSFTGTWASTAETDFNAPSADTADTTSDPKLVVTHGVVTEDQGGVLLLS